MLDGTKLKSDLAFLRTDFGESQSQAARRFYCSQSQISKLERGISIPADLVIGYLAAYTPARLPKRLRQGYIGEMVLSWITEEPKKKEMIKIKED